MNDRRDGPTEKMAQAQYEQRAREAMTDYKALREQKRHRHGDRGPGVSRRRAVWSRPSELATEADLVAEILQYLRLRGFWAWRTHDARHRPVSEGIPDIMAIGPHGNLIAVETKAQGEDLRMDQSAWMLELKGRGITFIVAQSVDDVITAGL